MSIANSSTSTSLLQQAKNHDPVAWERLAKLYGPLVYQWARQAGLQPDDAADVMQSVFASLSKNLVRFQRRTVEDSFRGWLFVLVRNQIRDFFRNKQKQVNAAGGTAALQMIHELAESAASSDSVDGQVEMGQLRRRALQLVQAEFEPRTWIAFWRLVVEGDDAKDIAADMGISAWTVYKAKARILKRLRDEFTDLL